MSARTRTINSYKLSLRKVGEEIPAWGKEPVFKYSLTVKGKGGKASFYSWGSIAEFRGEAEPSKPEEIFTMILDDAIAGHQYPTMNDIDEMASEFGITSVKEAIRVWKAFKSTYRKIKKALQISDNQLYDLANRMREKYG